MAKCEDCDVLIDEVSELTQKLSDTADKLNTVQTAANNLIEYVLKNNFISPDELETMGITVMPTSSKEAVSEIIEKVMSMDPDEIKRQIERMINNEPCDCPACQART